MDKQLLIRPFSREQINRRRGNKDQVFPFIKTETVIKRLFEATDVYHIKVIEKEVYEKEVVVLIRLNIDGQEIEAYGSAVINGSIANAIKAAQSDGLKRGCYLANMPCKFHSVLEDEQDESDIQEDEYKCSDCCTTIQKQVHLYSLKKMNKSLCMRCQQKYRAAVNK